MDLFEDGLNFYFLRFSFFLACFTIDIFWLYIILTIMLNIVLQVKQPKGEERRGELESTYEEKEQLSPVSVLDFPYEDDEIETPSSFEDSLNNMESTFTLFLHYSFHLPWQYGKRFVQFLTASWENYVRNHY